MKKGFKNKKIIIPIVLISFIVLIGFCYVNNYYHSDESVQKYLQRHNIVQVTEINLGLYLDGTGTDTAIIFYPGAKVEYTAYLPLLYQLAEQGYDCFVITMPCNLAVFGENKAKAIMEQYDYNHWYLSGHSLGGAMAASFASKHLDKLNGLILLASYPVKSLKSKTFSVLSIYGSEDHILNMDKFTENRNFMPSNYQEICIDGGNHAYFGNYGEQKGDGAATISREEQQEKTAKEILKFIENPF